jgi:hypothetical protein
LVLFLWKHICSFQNCLTNSVALYANFIIVRIKCILWVFTTKLLLDCWIWRSCMVYLIFERWKISVLSQIYLCKMIVPSFSSFVRIL